MRRGRAKTDGGRAFGFVKINLPQAGQEVTRESFTFQLDKARLKEAELRDGHYLLRPNLGAEDPAVLWDRYVQLTQIEAAFKCLKSIWAFGRSIINWSTGWTRTSWWRFSL